MYQRTMLPNGLRIVSKEIKDRDSIALGLWIGVGGRHESDSNKGIAHFLEHIVFKGSRKYNCDEIKMKVEGVGGALNAFTTEEQTCYFAKIPSKHLVQAFDVLADMVVYPKIEAKDVAKEKGVILEEIKMYHDLPQYQVLEALDGLMWPGHPLGKNLAGTLKTVSGISNRDLKKFHTDAYSPRNIVIAACGRLSHERIVKLAKQKLGRMASLESPKYLRVKEKPAAPCVKFVKKDIEQMHVALGVRGYDRNHRDRYALSLLSIILGGNMSSRLFSEVREKRGLAYSISCNYKALDDTGMFMVRAGVDNHKVAEAVGVIIKELNKIKRTGVTASEFNRGREYLSGQMLLGLEDTMEHMLWMGEGIITKNKVKTLSSILKELSSIRPADMKRVAKDVLNGKQYQLAIVGPITARQEREIQNLLSV